jgi:hypothetical protein
MGDESLKYILNRDDVVNEIKAHFQDAIKLIQGVVDYGTNLIPRCFAKSDRRLEDVVILGVLVKHIVSMMDAVDVLISQGCVYAANLQVRSIFEALLSIEYILKDDIERRAKYYYIWNLRQRLKWALRFISSTVEHEEFLTKLEKYNGILIDGTEKHKETAQQQVNAINEFLSKEPFAEINREFDRLKKRKKSDVSWYKPSGPNSISDMAKIVGYGAEYAVFYSQYSEIIHASGYLANIKFEANHIIFEPIRKLEELKTLLQVGIYFTIKTYQKILERYRPHELPNFWRKYVSDWRDAFKTIKEVSYNVQYHSL